MIKNILPIILTILFASCEYEDFDDNKDVESPLATCVDGIAKILEQITSILVQIMILWVMFL